ncbi:hypothetical protein BKA80DRAFT_122593 [Phyllosticta citrichinensis]
MGSSSAASTLVGLFMRRLARKPCILRIPALGSGKPHADGKWRGASPGASQYDEQKWHDPGPPFLFFSRTMTAKGNRGGSMMGRSEAGRRRGSEPGGEGSLIGGRRGLSSTGRPGSRETAEEMNDDDETVEKRENCHDHDHDHAFDDPDQLRTWTMWRR